MSNVSVILKDILNTDGVQDALVVGRDGFVIDHAGSLEADMIGVAVSTVIGSVESMGNTSKKGKLFEVMAEFDEGTILSAPIGEDAVLGVTADTSANLGAVRFAVKKNVKKLIQTL